MYYPPKGTCWITSDKNKILDLLKSGRIFPYGGSLAYKQYQKDFSYKKLTNIWNDARLTDMVYVCQTATKIIQRCILMTTDPGDLVLDPTCGSGTTAYVAEQWGRRWITIDTSRIALNIAKKRLTLALYPYYKTYDDGDNPNIRRGFVYKKYHMLPLNH